MSRSRAAARKRYLSLGIGEVVAAATIVVAGVVISAGWPGDSTHALWSAVIPLVLVLVQGGCYWLLARRWVTLGPMPSRWGKVFGVLRIVNPGVLVLGLVGVLVWWPASPLHAGLVLFAWAFGVIEYVNYFHVRLAYPASKWLSLVRQWRTPQLVKDMRGVGWA